MATIRINGRFYLRKTANGNLLGEWSNNVTPGIFTESCDSDGHTNQLFDGMYFSTWREGRDAFFATLTIRAQGSIFLLEWRGSDGNFDGQGMLERDGVLIGDYRSI